MRGTETDWRPRIALAAVIVLAIVLYLALARQATFSVPQAEPLLDRATTQDDAKAIGILPAHLRVPVTACVDLKSYPVYRVRLPDGREGYVNPDRRDLVVTLFDFTGPLVFNCF